MAVAIDEHGTLAGVLTIEDLVEVIVGEIRDEHDPTSERVTRLPDGTIEADGSIPLHELNEGHDLKLPESSDYVTLAGLILSRLGSLPQPGETAEVQPYRLTVLSVDERRISRARIERIEVTGSSAAGNGGRAGADAANSGAHEEGDP
jgi:putative hemolysin